VFTSKKGWAMSEFNHNTGDPVMAFYFTLLSVVSGSLASIISNMEVITRIAAAMVAIVSGFMAIRHYYYATKKIQKELKQP
jgi:uncharacterized membrane-anchored protein